jgi:hypothetical protein
MRGIVFSLATVMSVGIAVAGSRVIEADRASHGRPVTEPDAPSAVSPAGRLWYGGTLAPIIVVASPPVRAAARPAHAAHSCPPVGG